MSKEKEVKEIMLGVDKIKHAFDVRAKLNEEHALYLAELIDSGTKIPPIEVAEIKDDDGNAIIAMVDGRHRLHAYEAILEKKTVPVVFVRGTREELMIRALRSNTGGSLPTAGSDINLVIKQLLAMGVPKTRVVQQMSQPNLPFTPSLIRRHIETVSNQLTRDRLNAAQHAVAEGKMTTVEAASEFSVPLARLQGQLGGSRKKATVIADMTRTLTKTAHSRSLIISKLVARAIEMFEDGELRAKQVEMLLGQIEGINKRSQKLLEDFKRRYEDRKKALKQVA